MKYPRIYRLSTINLIYHQNYDYDFHPYRTDFTGDSGVGKSLIADLLQLIFIGSDEFKSATLSDGARPPRTMVFQRPNRGVDMGYAFLNIEKSHNQFIVIGIYIQNNEEHAKSFIIHQGQDFSDKHSNSLTPFDKPISYEDLIQENNIFSLEGCKKYLLDKYMYMEHIGHQRFFNILSKNEILPVEIDNYKESVKIYGEIIRTFARGSKISFSKDHELKRFLFGDEGKNGILKQFEIEEKKINESITTHESILSDIEKIEKNLKDLESLLKLKKESDEGYKKWVNAKIGFCKFQVHEAKILLDKNSQQIADSLNSLSLFENFLNDKAILLKNEQNALDEKLKNWEKISTDYQNLEKLNKWLKFHSETDPQRLKQTYREHIDKKKTQKQLTELNRRLSDSKISEDFKKSKWADGFNVGFEWNRNQIDELGRQLESKKAFEAFSDLENKDSLAYWAVNNYTSFTLEQESILMYFQTLSTKKPESPKLKDRFSNNPTSFLEKPVVEFKDDKGFYLNLGGVNEYILYDEERKLSSGNILEIRDYFGKLNTSIKSDISRINTDLTIAKSLFECLKSIPELVNAYRNSSKIENFKFNDDFDAVSEIELNSVINTHVNKEQIELDFESYSSFSQQREEISDKFTQAKALLIATEAILEKKESYELKAKQCKMGFLVKQDLPNPNFGELPSEWNSYFKLIKIPTLERYGEIVEDWISKEQTLEQIKNDFNDAEIDFTQIEFFKTSPDSLSGAFTKSRLAYEGKYDEIAKRELNELDFLKIKDNYDFLELGKEIYPDIIKDIKDLSDKDITEAISNSLNQIAERAKEFTKNKSDSLRTILQDFLLAKIETYKKLQKDIQAFFKTQKKLGNLISNEFEVKLSLNDGDINQQWITNTLSFADFNEFKDIISFKDFVLAVFRRMSDSDSQKDISIEKILNPNSYFRLNYKMSKTDGWDNIGISTGQNYAMVALLCIARLSIIEKESSIKKPEKGIRFMPIDEAEGLGSNFDLLHKIAKDKGYQIITMSIGTLDFLEEGNQTIYILHRNLEETKRPVNYPPEKIVTNIIEDENEVHEMEIFKGFK